MIIREFLLWLVIVALVAIVVINTHTTSKDQWNNERAFDALITHACRIGKEIITLRKELATHKAQIEDMTRPFAHVIPIDGGFLGIRE